MNNTSGFTLIELSIVLVIIGLIIGGVLVGRDLIQAAELRATIAQIEKYSAAVNTFRTKYNCLSGDCRDAAAFGFTARGLYEGEGDGNGILEGITADASGSNNPTRQTGENLVFWRDLSNANLIDGNFNTAVPNAMPASTISGVSLMQYFPQSKIGRNNFVYVYSARSYGAPGAIGSNILFNMNERKETYFGVSAINSVFTDGTVYSDRNIGPLAVYSIDKKIDDGLPTVGKVTAQFLNAIVPVCLAPCNIPEYEGTCFNNKGIDGGELYYSLLYGNSTACGFSISVPFQ